MTATATNTTSKTIVSVTINFSDGTTKTITAAQVLSYLPIP
jgi:hypothetical protein